MEINREQLSTWRWISFPVSPPQRTQLTGINTYLFIPPNTSVPSNPFIKWEEKEGTRGTKLLLEALQSSHLEPDCMFIVFASQEHEGNFEYEVRVQKPRD